METSSARNHSKSSASSSSMSSNRSMSKSKTYSDNISSGGSSRNDPNYSSYQNGGEMPDLNSAEFKREKDDFFGRVQRENANRRE